jgi:hypothetical protein
MDPRDDPYYFTGSFGSTGCHSKNLLHPQKTLVRRGDRLCFIQPGGQGFRVVYITPPIVSLRRVQLGRKRALEVLWPPSPPLKYDSALPLTLEMARCLNPMVQNDLGTLHSHFRTYSKPADKPDLVLNAYENWCSLKGTTAFATSDRETLDPVDQSRMHLTVYGKRGHASPTSVRGNSLQET